MYKAQACNNVRTTVNSQQLLLLSLLVGSKVLVSRDQANQHANTRPVYLVCASACFASEHQAARVEKCLNMSQNY